MKKRKHRGRGKAAFLPTSFTATIQKILVDLRKDSCVFPVK